jgi:menaquinone-dependent protoporphyrinogen IX oxidase
MVKIFVVYYSRYGNTAYVADKFLDALREKGEAVIYEIEYMGGKKKLIQRFLYRLMPSLVKLSPITCDLKEYDLICIGVPVWAGRPSAPVTKYLQLVKNIYNKKVICYYIYNFEKSAKSCSKYIHNILAAKGQPHITHIYIPWTNVHNEEFLSRVINQAMGSVSMPA